MVWYVGRGYVIQYHELMNYKGGHRAARAAKNYQYTFRKNTHTIFATRINIKDHCCTEMFSGRNLKVSPTDGPIYVLSIITD